MQAPPHQLLPHQNFLDLLSITTKLDRTSTVSPSIIIITVIVIVAIHTQHIANCYLYTHFYIPHLTYWNKPHGTHSSPNPHPTRLTMLYLIGLGLHNEKDITYSGLEIIRRASRVYLEAYTSILLTPTTNLETFYGRPIIIADREMVETGVEAEILHNAATEDVAFCVVGDPLGATTHTDLLLRARALNIPTRTIHNASIMNAIGTCGLSLYNFGQTVSMVFFTESWRPHSFWDRVRENRGLGLHTLVLLDIKVKEQSLENMARGRKVYEPARYMTVNECCRQMLEVVEEKVKGVESEGEDAEGVGESGVGKSGVGDDKEARVEAVRAVYHRESLAIGVARLGSPDQVLVAGTLEQLCGVDFGGPLHSLVLLGKRCHVMEMEYVREFAVDKELWERVWRREYE